MGSTSESPAPNDLPAVDLASTRIRQGVAEGVAASAPDGDATGRDPGVRSVVAACGRRPRYRCTQRMGPADGT